MRIYDTLYFKNGNPKPKGGVEFQVNQAKKMYSELSPETKEFFDIMVNEELMDLDNREGKRPGGFCTSFPSYARPYIFSNFKTVSSTLIPLLLSKEITCFLVMPESI